MEFQDKNPDNQKVSRFLDVFQNPRKFLMEGGKYGIKGVKRFLMISILFAFVNSCLVFFSLIKLINLQNIHQEHIIYFLLSNLVSIAFVAFAAYKAYHFVLKDSLRVVYQFTQPFFKKISDSIIEKSNDLMNDKIDLKHQKLSKVIDISKILFEQYGKVPTLLKSAIDMIINKIPIVGMLNEMREMIFQEDKEKASQALFRKIDGFITEKVFGDNNTNWIFWLLPLNITIHLLIAFLKIS